MLHDSLTWRESEDTVSLVMPSSVVVSGRNAQGRTNLSESYDRATPPSMMDVGIRVWHRVLRFINDR